MSVFKIFALLMCQGNLRRKAEAFFEIATGTLERNENPKLAFNSGRLKKAIKNILFFSEIFPKKYIGNFVAEIDNKVIDH